MFGLFFSLLLEGEPLHIQEEKTKILLIALMNSIQQSHTLHLTPPLVLWDLKFHFHLILGSWFGLKTHKKMNHLQHLHREVTLARDKGHWLGNRLELLILASLSCPRNYLEELPVTYPV